MGLEERERGRKIEGIGRRERERRKERGKEGERA